ncbi:hypothetical protein B0H13DRAFT_1913266 [Mycena leptocephala]|nr:hypothetical protein B0H13DRAFT_1913266 [Mycena leptocephala]
MSEEAPPAIFEDATRISPNDIMAYRKYAFPAALSDPSNEPFFSVEDATIWITSLGYQLYLVHDDSELNDEPNMPKLTTGSAPPPSLFMPANAKSQTALSKRNRKSKAKPDFAIKLTQELKKGPLAGSQIQGRRPAERPSGVDTSSSPEEGLALEREHESTPLPEASDVPVDFSNSFSASGTTTANASASDSDHCQSACNIPKQVTPSCLFDTTRDSITGTFMSVNAWEYFFSDPSNSATTSTSAADTSSSWDQFNLDPSTFNFGDYRSDLSADFPGYRPTGVTRDIYGLSAEELEYIGPPTEYPGMALPGINSDVHSFAAYGDLPGAVHYSGFGLSQALPHLPPLPASPSHTELEETDITSAAALIR